MALNIKSDEAHELARELAEATGTSMTDAVTEALRRTLGAETRPARADLLIEEVAGIQRFVADLPDRDRRTPEEILGYARFGKGVGDPGVLSYGDCLAYGVAMAEAEPLLFKGDDFVRTDVTAVEY